MYLYPNIDNDISIYLGLVWVIDGDMVDKWLVISGWLVGDWWVNDGLLVGNIVWEMDGEWRVRIGCGVSHIEANWVT